MRKVIRLTVVVCLFVVSINAFSQSNLKSTSGVKLEKKISENLFGIFFEDISYAADGGLYAELLQNRSFEYTSNDKNGWNPLTAWEYVNKGYGYGTVSVETALPVSSNNRHYIELNVEEVGKEGVGLINFGYDGIAVRVGEKYDFSCFIRQISDKSIPIRVILQNKKGKLLGEATFNTNSTKWEKYSTVITATQDYDSARFVILAKSTCKFALDVVSLFPHKTFKERANGMRADLATIIADLHPKFMRFPGGCLVHGDGLANMYNWKNTIGPIEERVEQRNIWNYHQTAGLGYFEYFQFCEDIGAQPLPILPAAVSCQNSGGTWVVGGTGQRALPLSEMNSYIQDINDLIEYANGAATTTWGAKRVAAGHAASFNLRFVGIGNEDKMTPEFKERFDLIYSAIKKSHPEITVVGTAGPAPSGEDFEKGWEVAKKLSVPVIDEHYYEKPTWFLSNTHRYDQYDRNHSQVYIGEYASQGNTLFNAVSEAVYMTSIERNGDIVKMASYAHLLARIGNTSWNPDLIYFNNVQVVPSVNYYVQQLFGRNQGDVYYNSVLFGTDAQDSTLGLSCVKDSKTGDLILKIANAGTTAKTVTANLKKLGIAKTAVAQKQLLVGQPNEQNTLLEPKKVIPTSTDQTIGNSFTYESPAFSLTVFRIKANAIKK